MSTSFLAFALVHAWIGNRPCALSAKVMSIARLLTTCSYMEREVVQLVQVVAWVCTLVVHHQCGSSNRLCIDVLGYFFVCHCSLSLLD